MAASLVASISTEIVNTARAISKARPDVTLNNVEHFESWFIRNYRHMVQDPSSLYTAMKTNSAYDGENVREKGWVGLGDWMKVGVGLGVGVAAYVCKL